MFGDDTFEEIIDELLKDFTLEELFELNDLTDRDVLEILLTSGFIGEPERYLNS